MPSAVQHTLYRQNLDLDRDKDGIACEKAWSSTRSSTTLSRPTSRSALSSRCMSAATVGL